MKRIAATTGLTLLLALFCGAGQAAGPVSGGTLVFALDRQPVTLIPLTSNGNSVQQVGPKIFDGLLIYDRDLKPHPQLATAWAVSSDGLSYTFKLRPGVKWHDGAPFTAADVAFSLMLAKQVNPLNRIAFANLTNVEMPDPLTAIVHFSRPAPFFLTALAASETPMIPKHVLAGLDPNAPVAQDKVIGTGPFMFKQLESHDYLVLVRNPAYWDKGKPYLDRIIFRFIADPGARAAALETGEIDAVDTAVSPADVDWLAKTPNLTVTRIRPPYPALERQLMFNLDRPQVRNIKVRQAIAHAIDLDAIARIVQFGQAWVTPSPITEAAFNDPKIRPYKVDLALANALLDQAHFSRGWGGARFVLKLRYNATADARTAEYIRSALSKIGIRVEIVRTDLPIYLKAVYTDRDFDMTIESLSNTFDPSLGVQRIYWSKNFKPGVPYTNGPHYANPRVDRLLEDAANQPDAGKRKADFEAFQAIVHDDLPIIDLYAPEGIIVANKRVHDAINGAGGTEYNFANTWLTPR